MRFPVPSSLKASGSSFCGESQHQVVFATIDTTVHLYTCKLSYVLLVLPFQSQSEVRIDLQRHNLQPTEINRI